MKKNAPENLQPQGNSRPIHNYNSHASVIQKPLYVKLRVILVAILSGGMQLQSSKVPQIKLQRTLNSQSKITVHTEKQACAVTASRNSRRERDP